MIGLDVKNITVTYKNGHTAIHDTSFSLPRGTITALVGVNGSGKSTLFKSIMGFVSLAAGSVEILGLPVKKALRSNQVAYVPQSEEIDWNFPVLVEDVVMMGRYGHMNIFRHAKPKDHQMVEMALSRVGMESFRGRQIGELSGGQKKRVFLARALAQESQIVLLDEPLAALDPLVIQDIQKYILKIQASGTAVMVTDHNVKNLFDITDRSYVLGEHTVIAEGTSRELLKSSKAIEHYFGSQFS